MYDVKRNFFVGCILTCWLLAWSLVLYTPQISIVFFAKRTLEIGASRHALRRKCNQKRTFHSVDSPCRTRLKLTPGGLL